MSFQAWSSDGKRVVIVERETVQPDALFDDWHKPIRFRPGRFGMTQSQKDGFDFIKKHTENFGVSPSFREIKKELGLKSLSEVHRIVTALVDRGRVGYIPRRARSLVITSVPR